MTLALSIRDLTHEYPPARPRGRRRTAANVPAKTGAGPTRALDGVSFDVNAGEVFGILGPNGSGKTSLFRIIATLMRPTGGQVHVFDCDAVRQADQVRRMLGIVFQAPSLDIKLTAEENLMHQGHLYGLSGKVLAQQIDALLAMVGLAERRGELVERFSGGMRRRVELAKSLLHGPQLLLLDEPATGLDVGGRHDLWDHLRQLRKQRGTTIVLTTHLMDEAERCDRLAVMDEGRIVALDTPADLKGQVGGDVVTVEPEDAGEADELCNDITAQFGPWPHGGEPSIARGQIHLEKPDGAAFVATLAPAIAGRARSITVGRPTLEDVFLHLTGHSLERRENDA